MWSLSFKKDFFLISLENVEESTKTGIRIPYYRKILKQYEISGVKVQIQ
jgi:hypothetical protein